MPNPQHHPTLSPRHERGHPALDHTTAPAIRTRISGADVDDDAPLPGCAAVLPEIDPLPGSEGEATADHRDREGRSGEGEYPRSAKGAVLFPA